MPKKKTLLIVDDDLQDAATYQALLESFEHDFTDIVHIDNLDEAFKSIVHHPPACCLLDYNFPTGCANTLLEQLRDSAKNQVLCPFVIVTGNEDTQIAVELMRLGAQDYLSKSDLNAKTMEKAITAAQRTFHLEKRLNHLALHDPLTNLPNRNMFVDKIEQIYQDTKVSGTPFALLIIDLDRFKFINETYGHDAGDELLIQVSSTIVDTLRSTDMAARLGGDEFAVILPNITEANANMVAEKLTTALRRDIKWNNINLSLSASTGLAIYPSSAKSYQELMREADMALYRAKQSGRDQYSIFDQDMKDQTIKNMVLSSALETAIINNELQIAYQPIYDLKTNQISEVEALVRWNFNGEWISPPIIIELVIERRLSHLFHQWLFDTSIEQLKIWQKENPKLGLSVNIPASLCHEPQLSKQLLSVINRKNINPNTVIVELTETHLMGQPNETREQLTFLAQQGLRIAIDDFGTGYSSMEYLASLPCDLLKIDQQFFLKLEKNTKNKKIIEAIIGLAHGLDLCVVGEGLETTELIGLAQDLTCDYGQGFGLGFPKFAKLTLKEFTFDTLPPKLKH